MNLIFQDWGLIDYETALQKQTELVETTHKEGLVGYLIFCTHPPVVTLGRATKPEDVFGWTGKVIEISRGGRATYHGPSQLVVYPILNLTHPRKGRKDREIIGYLRALEDSIVEVLGEYDIHAQGRSLQKNPHTESVGDETGVWVERQKIASLGIGVRKWITYHGAAINLTYDPKAFIGMNPCGFKTETMVSLEQLLQNRLTNKKIETPMKIQADEVKALNNLEANEAVLGEQVADLQVVLDVEEFKLKLKTKLLEVL